jgi:type IX secretion system PorP/SprF family membrane protein
MAQHTPLTSQYLFNGLLINPAYAGSRDAMALNLTYRKQWVGFDGAPSTQILSVHTPIKRTRLAVGALLVNDKIGVSRETGVLANCAYRLPLRKGKLQFGIGAGVSILQADWTSLALQERSDVQFAADTRGALEPNFSTGLFYYTKTYFVGASVPFVMGHGLDVERNKWTLRNDKAQYQPMLTGGYVFKLNREMKLKPSTLLRYQVAGGVQTDVSANLIIRDKIWTGISYRYKDSVVGSFEVLPTPQWRLGYAYDLGLSALTPYHSGTHELMLQYEFGKRINVRDPRYF